MTRITVDASVASQLHELYQPVQLCDPSGRVLGEFVPAFDPSKWELVGPEPTEEELDLREKETESYTTAEVLAFLEKVPCSESDGNGSR